MTSSYRMYTVDAFAEKPFSGNPAGVCLLMDAKLDDKQLLQIAAEMRHSETSFVTKHAEYSETNPIFGLRWFTPSVEVNLCGHATLATAHVLFNEEKMVTGDTLLFETLSGILKVERRETLLELDFPRGFPMQAHLDNIVKEKILKAFELPSGSIVDLAFCTQTKKLILELPKPSLVWAAKVPSPDKLTSIQYGLDVRGISLACGSQLDGWKEEFKKYETKLKDCDFMSRYFSPWNGIPEDPVNGSSHTILPHFYKKKLHKYTMKAYMASPREGYLLLTLKLDPKNRVFIAGNAVTVLSGTFKF